MLNKRGRGWGGGISIGFRELVREMVISECRSLGVDRAVQGAVQS